MVTSFTLLDGALALSALFILKKLFSKKPVAPSPPGPPPKPLLGNLLDMPSEKEWLTFADWGQKWGAQLYLNSKILISADT